MRSYPSGAEPPDVPRVTALVRIGGSGYATVYRGRQPDTGRGVAVKVLPAPLDRTSRALFDREQSRIRQLRDTLVILPVDEVGVLADGRPYLITELCTDSCADRLRRDGPFPAGAVARLGRDLAGGLARAHERGVVHGGVTPGNVLFRRSGTVALSDFGTALRQIHLGDPNRDDEFAAPETLCDGVLSPQSDLYGLGATLYAALTGRPPFPARIGEHPGARILRVINEPVPPLALDAAPPELADLLGRLLASDPEGRPESAAWLAVRFAGLAPEPSPARVEPAPPPPAPPPPTAPPFPPAPPAGPPPPTPTPTRQPAEPETPEPSAPATRPGLGSAAEPSTDWSRLLDEFLSEHEPIQLRPAQLPRKPPGPPAPVPGPPTPTPPGPPTPGSGAAANRGSLGGAAEHLDRPRTHRVGGLVAAVVVAVLLLALASRLAPRSGSSGAATGPGTASPVPGATAAPLAVHLVTVRDGGESAQLTWTGDPAMEYAVVVAQSGHPVDVVLVNHAHSARVPILPGRPYCFLIQATNGAEVIETDPRPIRGAVCNN